MAGIVSAAESELDAVRFDVIRQRVAAGKRLGINFSDPEPGMNTAVVHYVLDVEFLLDQCDDGTKCLYADTFDGRCALAATSDSPPPERVQMAELVRANERLRQQCDKWRRIADAFAAGVERDGIEASFHWAVLIDALEQWREAQ